MRLCHALFLVLLVSPASVHATGLNLAWNKCLPEGGVIAKTFACNNNTEYADIIGSFTPAQPHPRFIGIEVKLDVQSQSQTVPAWWQFFNSGSCRTSAYDVSFDFRALPTTYCDDPFNGGAWGGVGYYATSIYPRAGYQPPSNMARMGMAAAVMNPRNLSPGTEYYAFRLRLQYESSSGGGACDGCSSPVCLTLSEVAVYDLAPPSAGGQWTRPPAPEVISQQAQNFMISWQDNGTNCQSAVKNKTWGQLKSLYR